MIIYNCVSLSWPQTRVHVMSPGYDPSRSDQLLTVIRLEVKAVLYMSDLDPSIFVPPSTPADFAAGTPATISTLTRIRHMLTSPRRPFYWDATTVSTPGTAPAAGTAVYLNLPTGRDDANGPLPDEGAFRAVYVTPDAIEITWACTISLRDCGSTDGSLKLVPLSIRWTDSLSWDKNWRCTYRRRGTMIISSQGPDIETFRRRGYMLPGGGATPTGVTPGFQRIRAHYEIAKNGLSCDFEFIDEQIRFGPPKPGSSLVIVQSESSPLPGGGMRRGAVSVTMDGIMGGSVWDLARIAITICTQRMWAAGPNLFGADQPIIKGSFNLETTESCEGYAVRCSAAYFIPPGNANNRISDSLPAPAGAFDGALNLIYPGLATVSLGLRKLADIADIIAPVITPTGKANPAMPPLFGWVGAGTFAPGTAPNIPDFLDLQPWADIPGAAIASVPITEGYLMATNVGLFAAVLGDPCGNTLSVNPTVWSGSLAAGTATTTGKPSQPFNSPPCAEAPPPSPPSPPTPGGTYPYPVEQWVTPPGQSNSALLTATYTNAVSNMQTLTTSTSLSDGYWIWDGAPAIYDHWQCETSYEENPGVIVMPTCNPNGTNLPVNHSSSMIYVIKKWAARRTGSPPNIPPKNTGDSNLIYVGGSPRPRELQVGTDGISVDYMITGEYRYQAIDPSLVDLAAEIPPYLSPVLSSAAQWIDLYEQTGTNPNGGPNSPNPLGNNQLPNQPPQ